MSFACVMRGQPRALLLAAMPRCAMAALATAVEDYRCCTAGSWAQSRPSSAMRATSANRCSEQEASSSRRQAPSCVTPS